MLLNLLRKEYLKILQGAATKKQSILLTFHTNKKTLSCSSTMYFWPIKHKP